MELALTGENLPAERAHELGLVNVLAEPGHALEAAIGLAERITVNGPPRWPPPNGSSPRRGAGHRRTSGRTRPRS